MSFEVEKLVWEYGERYGHAFFPHTSEEFRLMLDNLDAKGTKGERPFYVETYFTNDTFVGLIVGGIYSCLDFGVAVSELHLTPSRTLLDVHFDAENRAFEGYYQYSFKADHGELDAARALPKDMAMKALRNYARNGIFPSNIEFTRKEFNAHYVAVKK